MLLLMYSTSLLHCTVEYISDTILSDVINRVLLQSACAVNSYFAFLLQPEQKNNFFFAIQF